jgi:CheY-like chemotaxis protein
VSNDVPSAVRVWVVADDLIWASRLSEAVQRAGATPVRATGEPSGDVDAALVDLNGRGYDGVERVATLVAAGIPVVCVGQHEDLPLRKRALAAGARRVYSYNHMFRHGPQVVAELIAAREGASA